MSLFESELFASPLFEEDAPTTASPSPVFTVTRGDAGTPFTFSAPVKDPSSIELHGLDWSGWLSAGDSIATADVFSDLAGLTISQIDHAAGVVSYRIAEGVNGANYIVTCRITTAFGLSDDRSVQYRVRER